MPSPDYQTERLRRLSDAEIRERDRCIDQLAESLYLTYKVWRCQEFNETQPYARWFALDPKLKRPYLFAARSLLSDRVG